MQTAPTRTHALDLKNHFLRNEMFLGVAEKGAFYPTVSNSTSAPHSRSVNTRRGSSAREVQTAQRLSLNAVSASCNLGVEPKPTRVRPAALRDGVFIKTKTFSLR